MAFWKDGSAAPKRNYRWLVRMHDGNELSVAWWAKTVNVPSYEVSEIEHNFLDNKYYYPGRVSWSEITLTLVDPADDQIDAVGLTLNMLKLSDYLVKDLDMLGGGNGNPLTISKQAAMSAGVTDLSISVLDAGGNEIEIWTLHNPFVKSAKYGDLDYSNDDLRTVEMVVRYDWASCLLAGGSTGDFDPTVEDQEHK